MKTGDGVDEGRLVRTRGRAVRAWLLVAALTALWVALTTPLFLQVWLYWLAFCAAFGSLLVIVYGVIHVRHTGKWMSVPVLALVVALFVASKALGALADYAVKNVPLPVEPMRGVLDIPTPALEVYIAVVLGLMIASVVYTVVDR